MAARREQVVKTAERFVARGKIEAAIKEYRKVLSDQPNDSTTLNRVGDLYARIERIDEAIHLFSQIAENYTGDGFFVKAIAIYKKIIKLDPTQLEVYERLAELYHRQGLVNEARTQYQVLADYYLKHENRASALSIYERMADLEPENPSPRVKLAELYQEQKLTDKAIGEYRTIAELMISHGHADEAAQVYQRALDVDASDVGFITDAVLRLEEAGHTAIAARLLSVAVEKNPEAERVARLVGLGGEAPAAAEEAAAVAQAPAAPEERGGTAPPPAQTPPPAEATAGEDRGDQAAVAADATGDEIVLDLDQAPSELPFAAGPPTSPPAAAPVPAESADAVTEPEIELDLDDVFVLDLDDDEPPSSLVQPPPDVVGDEPPLALRSRPDAAGERAPPPPPAPAEPAAEPAAEASSLEVEPPPELEEEVFRWDERPAEPQQEETPAAAAASAPADAIDPDFLERTAAELQPQQIRPVEDLVTEAEVLAKYGLEEKAAERLQEAIRRSPGHLEAMSQLIRLDLDSGRHVRVVTVANQLARASVERGGDAAWAKVRRRLEGAGFLLEGERVMAPPPRQDEGDAAVGRMLAGLLDDTGGATAARAGDRKPAPPPAAEALPPAEAPPPDEPPEASLADLAADILERGAAEPGAEAERLDDSGTAWLDEVEQAAGAGGSATVFDEEEDFFDLAAEIEQELDAEESHDEDLLAAPREQSLEEIVEGFKQGVAENLSAEDYDTHFNLGIAYREMGLLDEAIGEFQLAAKDIQRLVECCSMLGLCFLEKGLPELAVKWYQRGLAHPDLAEEDQLGLLYDLGNVHLATGDFDQAHALYVDIYGTNSNYRDVVAKLEEVAARRGD